MSTRCRAEGVPGLDSAERAAALGCWKKAARESGNTRVVKEHLAQPCRLASGLWVLDHAAWRRYLSRVDAGRVLVVFHLDMRVRYSWSRRRPAGR